MEGYLLVPPERNALIGRTAWKKRFVVLAIDSRPRPSPPTTSSTPAGRFQSSLHQLKLSTSRNTSLLDVREAPSDSLALFIYKQKGDRDAIARYPLSLMVSCTVENITHRKSNALSPTLILHFASASTERTRTKLRQHQAPPRSTPKPHTTAVHLRSAPDSPESILDWHDTLHVHLTSQPQSPHFDSAHSSSDKSSRPSTSTTRPALPPSQGSHVSTSSSKAASAILSPTLSLRSSHTGISSPNPYSPNNPQQTFRSSPSPTADVHNSHHHRRPPSTVRSRSPPPPRETILDRAFMMNCIPGAPSSPYLEQDRNMTSIARFEALMQEKDAKKAAAAVSGSRSSSVYTLDHAPEMSTSAQRALDFIAAGSTSSTPRARKKSSRSRPASIALVSSSNRTSLTEDVTDKRRSSTSIAAKKANRVSMSHYSDRLSTTSTSKVLTRADTASTSNRSSYTSEGSFGCAGEDNMMSHRRDMPILSRPHGWRASASFGI
ncbi:MAG: hypothetical protein M1817_006638 [Caeruleum heppii]|nr:MAG: hypothetical protein M1817_006638 [Caeruleum heppii]